MNKSFLIVVLLFMTAAGGLTADVIRVPVDQPTIQAGIDAAMDGDTVLVAEGYYYGPGNRDIDFNGKAILVTSETGREYCIIDCEKSGRGFYFHHAEYEDSILRGFTIRHGYADYGGGISCWGSFPTIVDCKIIGCEAAVDGGGIHFRNSAATVDKTIIAGNRVDRDSITDGAGGIYCDSSSPEISNSIIWANYGVNGGGVHCAGRSSPIFINCLISSNAAFYMDWYYYEYHYGGWGGAFYAEHPESAPVLKNCTLTWNDAYSMVAFDCDEGTITNSILWNTYVSEISGNPSVTFCDVEGGYDGEGNFDTDPLFCSSYDYEPTGDSFLSQTEAGQSEQSPCVDAGSASAESFDLDIRSTRTDFVPDAGAVDLGYHYLEQIEEPNTRIVFGPDYQWVNSPVLIFIYTGEDDIDPPSDLDFSYLVDEEGWSEFSSSTTTVISTSELTITQDPQHYFRVRCRDTDGNIDPIPSVFRFFLGERTPDHWAGIVTGPGPGPHNPPLVRTSQAEWLAYGVLKYGVNVACANLDGDGLDEVITGAGPGPPFGPHVRGWTLDGQPVPGVSFMAYGTNHFGVNVASGDIDADGLDEIITGAGPGAVFGPHVRGWNYDGSGSITAMSGVNYFAYGTPKWGVNVTAGDVDGDGFDEIITGAGPGAVYGPHIRGWNCDGVGPVTPIPEISFFAYNTLKWGVNAACGDLDGDGDAEIISGAGPGGTFGAHVRAWDFDGTQITPMKGVSFFAYDSLFGVRVAAGDVDGDGIDEILTVTGPSLDQHADIRVWSVNDGIVTRDHSFRAYDEWMTHGGSVAGGNLN